MLNSVILNYRFWCTIIASIALGYLLVSLLPLFETKPILLVAFPLGLIFMVLLITKPTVVLAGVILVRPLLDNLLDKTKVSVASGGGGFGLGAILNVVIVVLAIFLAFYTQYFPRRVTAIKVWFVMLAFLAISAAHSPFLVAAIRLCFNYMSYFSIFLLPFLVVKSRESFLFWLKILCWSFVLPVLFANIDLLRGGDFYADAGNRIRGTFTHPNVLAYYLVLGISIFFIVLKGQFFKVGRFAVWMLRVFILNMIVLLVATKTRNGWIALFLIAVIYGALKDRRVILTLLFVLPLLLCIPQVHDRFASVTGSEDVGDYRGMNSWDWRVNMWKSSFSMIREKPLEGYGLTSYLPLSSSFSTVGGSKGAHNAYLETLFETGIFGLLSYVWLLAYPVSVFARNMLRSAGTRVSHIWTIAGAFMASYMVICFADNLTYYLVFNWYVWFFVSLMMSSRQYWEQAKNAYARA